MASPAQEYNNQTGINVASVSIFFSKYQQSNEILPLKWAEHSSYFPNVFLNIYAYVKKQILLGLDVFFLWELLIFNNLFLCTALAVRTPSPIPCLHQSHLY